MFDKNIPAAFKLLYGLGWILIASSVVALISILLPKLSGGTAVVSQETFGLITIAAIFCTLLGAVFVSLGSVEVAKSARFFHEQDERDAEALLFSVTSRSASDELNDEATVATRSRQPVPFGRSSVPFSVSRSPRKA